MTKYVSEHAQVAKLIRAELKKNGIVGKVRSEGYRGGNSVGVTLSDLPPWTIAEIEKYCAQYQYGQFDGMTDYYEFNNVNKDIPQVRYVTVTCEFSDGVKDAAYQHIKSLHPEDFAGAPATYKELDWRHQTSESHQPISQIVRRVLANTWPHSTSSHYWQKPRIKAEAAL